MPRARRPVVYNPVLTEVEKGVVEGLQEAGGKVLKRAKELVPVDSGALKRSGKLKTEHTDVLVRFTAPHAWLTHERTEDRHPNGGQAKYLETALSEVDVGKAVATGIAAVFRG